MSIARKFLKAGIQNLGILMIGEVATTTLPQHPSTPRFDAYESIARKKKKNARKGIKKQNKKKEILPFLRKSLRRLCRLLVQITTTTIPPVL